MTGRKPLSVAVVGAGPAGLMCALTLARGGAATMLFERNAACGRKLLVSGQGRCNLTQDTDADGIAAAFFEKSRFVKPAAYAFTPADARAFFVSCGVPTFVREDGKVFPRSESAVQVRDALTAACRAAGVVFRTGERVTAVDGRGPFILRGERGESHADAVVLACGGASYPATGSDGSAYALARGLGHAIVPPRPALAGIRIDDPLFTTSAGIAFDDIAVTCGEGKKAVRSRGAAVCTHQGLSGPVILRLSREIKAGDQVCVDFAPSLGREACVSALCAAASDARSRQVKTVVAEFVPQRLAERLVVGAGIAADARLSQCPKAQLLKVAESVCAYRCRVAAVGGFGEAMATRGGVATDEIDAKTMASRLVPGLYFAGEFMDIDGDTGGYNIQMAFATGVLAAHSVLKRGLL